jgi:RNA 2',3'-cyclic 3'-phosphodiesterase
MTMNSTDMSAQKPALSNSSGELSKPLFVAIPLPSSVLNMLKFFVENNKSLDIRWIPESNYHVTLLYIGRVNPDLVSAIKSSLTDCIETISPFTLSFREISVIQHKGRDTMIWAKFHENEEFIQASQKILGALVSLVPIIVSFKKPIPHVTLSRLKRSADLHRLNVTVPENVLTVDVKHCELWESNKGDTGTFYKRISSFNLAE